MIGRRADRGEHDRQCEGAPGRERRARRRRPAQPPERPGTDREERQVAQHVGGVRHAEPGAAVGEDVVVGPLHRSARAPRAGAARTAVARASRPARGSPRGRPREWMKARIARLLVDGIGRWNEEGAASSDRGHGPRQAARAACPSSATRGSAARFRPRRLARGGNRGKGRDRRGHDATRRDIDVAETRGPLLRWQPSSPRTQRNMLQQRQPNLLSALSAVGSWAVRNGMAPRSGGVRAPI